jgi:REP element-mobilizing transposase RayT
MVVGGKTSSTPQEKDTKLSHNLLKSDRIKWSLAYAKQQLAMHPDTVMYDLKYHLCIVTKFRQPHFLDASRYAEEIDDIIRESYEASARTVQFLSMGADHLHLYIDATPDDVMDDVVQSLLADIEPKIQEIVWGDTSSGKALCNPVFFIETI